MNSGTEMGGLMPKVKTGGIQPQLGPLPNVPGELTYFASRFNKIVERLNPHLVLSITEQERLLVDLKLMLKEGEQFFFHPNPAVTEANCDLYRGLERVLDARPAGDRAKNCLPLVRGQLQGAEQRLLVGQAPAPKAPPVPPRPEGALLGGATAAAGRGGPQPPPPAGKTSPKGRALPPVPGNLLQVHPFGDRLSGDVTRLTREFSHLEPLKQGRLLTDIGARICTFAETPVAQAHPGERGSFIDQLQVLATSGTGALRLFDKKTRQSVKEALTTLSQVEDPKLSVVATLGLNEMTPDFVRQGESAEGATELLKTGLKGNFVVRSTANPEEEFCVDLKTPEGVKHYALFEKAAENGAILYTFDGITHYTSLSSLVSKELVTARGFAMLGEKPDKDLTEKAQREFIQPGVKFDKTRIGDVKVSHIKGSDGQEYIVSNTQGKGGFGKFRYAIDREGNRWAVKEFRSQYARHKPKAKTNITNMEAISDEIAVMAKVGVDFKIRDSMNIQGKVYAVMPIMEGEVGENIDRISKKKRKIVAMSVLRQIASDLRQCHKEGYVHRDVKLANALWNRRGKISLSDFGLAVLRPNPKEKLHDRSGTICYMAPEVFDPKGYGVKVDAWSLGLSVADILVDWWESPFVPPRGVSAGTWCPQNFEDYSKWRSALVGSDGKIKMGSVGKKRSDFDDYFGKLKAADPVLCEFLLERVLVTTSANRATMREIGEFCDGVQGPTSTNEGLARLAFKKLAGTTSEREEIFALLEKERQVSS